MPPSKVGKDFENPLPPNMLYASANALFVAPSPYLADNIGIANKGICERLTSEADVLNPIVYIKAALFSCFANPSFGGFIAKLARCSSSERISLTVSESAFSPTSSFISSIVLRILALFFRRSVCLAKSYALVVAAKKASSLKPGVSFRLCNAFAKDDSGSASINRRMICACVSPSTPLVCSIRSVVPTNELGGAFVKSA